MTPGVEIHANALQTILNGNFLRPVPEWVTYLTITLMAGATVAIAAALPHPGAIWAVLVLMAAHLHPHHVPPGLADLQYRCHAGVRRGLIGGIIYRFIAAEKKSSFSRARLLSS